MPQSVSPRTPKVNAALTAAAVVATTAALTAGVAPSVPETIQAGNRVMTANVEPVALEIPALPDFVGIYGVGPVFWTAQLLGLTPTQVVETAAGLLGGTEAASTVTDLLTLLDTISPVEAGIKGPLPSDVYDAVNGLDYTGIGTLQFAHEALSSVLGAAVVDSIWNLRDPLGILGTPGATVGQAVTNLVKSTLILNQRRALIFSENLGGLTTSLAYRDMIKAVQSNDPAWGGDAAGVTAQWLVFFNNVSRPGGGLAALATPFAELFGMNLSTPDAGSYTNADANNGKITKVLNTSILDIGYAYSLMSDAPTTLNPLSWANALAGAVFLTYLLPDSLDFSSTNLGSQLGPLASAIVNGAGVIADITGGQGTKVVPLLGDLLDHFDANLPGVVGKSTYITYDSGNLPLLEPLDMVPHLLNLVPGVHIPTTLTDSIEDALTMMVNMGYQDVDPEDLTRSFAEAGDQAYLWHSPLTPTQQLAATQTVFDALVTGVQNHALTPSEWTPTLPGVDLSPITENAVNVAVSQVLRDALGGVKTVADQGFDAMEKGLKPVTDVADGIDKQISDALDNLFKVNGNQAPAAKQQQPQAKSMAVDTNDTNARTLTLATDSAPQPRATQLRLPHPAPRTTVRSNILHNDTVKKSVQETIDKVRGSVEKPGKAKKRHAAAEKSAPGKHEKQSNNGPRHKSSKGDHGKHRKAA